MFSTERPIGPAFGAGKHMRVIALGGGVTVTIEHGLEFEKKVRAAFALSDDEPVSDEHMRQFVIGAVHGAQR